MTLRWITFGAMLYPFALFGLSSKPYAAELSDKEKACIDRVAQRFDEGDQIKFKNAAVATGMSFADYRKMWIIFVAAEECPKFREK
jgi:hypothetical protein